VTSRKESRANPARASALHRSPFAVLGATTWDDRARIAALAEEKSVEMDPEVCQRARSDLTSLRTRLAAEVSWLPGVAPEKVPQLLERMLSNPIALWGEKDLPTMARLNVLAATFDIFDGGNDEWDIRSAIQTVAELVEELRADDVLLEINGDRAKSGFSSVRAGGDVDAVLSCRRQDVVGAIKAALDRLPTLTMVNIITDAVSRAIDRGGGQAAGLIDDLVDRYESEAQGFLEAEGNNARKLITTALDAARSGSGDVGAVIDRLSAVIRNWQSVALPIQVSAEARGTEHPASRELAREISNLSAQIWTDRRMLMVSIRLVDLLREAFCHVPEIREQAERHAEELAEIRKEREKDIFCRVQVGLRSEETFSISLEGISYKGKVFPLESITSVGWGPARRPRHSYGSEVPHAITFGDRDGMVDVTSWREDVYKTVVDKLWQAVGIRLLLEMLNALKAGEVIKVGGAEFRDEGVSFVKKNLAGSEEQLYCTWNQVDLRSEDGMFHVSPKRDKSFCARLSYVQDAKTRLLEQAILYTLKEPSTGRLSDWL